MTRGPITAAEVANALRGKKSGRGWSARCPAHDDRHPSLSICEAADGKILVRCHAGCEQGAVIDALRARGIWPDDAKRDPSSALSEARERRDRQHAERIAATVQRIWDEAQDPRGTAAERYLLARALRLPSELCNSALRFHSKCPWENGTAACLIAAFTREDNRLSGIHRIRVDQPERWPKTERLTFGSISGSAIKLGKLIDGRLFIGEGLETCLSSYVLGRHPVWAVGSALAIAKFKQIDAVNELTILGEHDLRGTNRAAAERLRENWPSGRVLWWSPPQPYKDLNDYLMGRAA